MKNYAATSQEILKHIGGKENIVSAAHCTTRLRLVLKDDSLININAIEAMDIVKGNFNNAGQFQIILGPGIVDEVYKELQKMADLSDTTKEALKKDADNKLNPLQKIIKTLADAFVPILPAIVAGGLLMGINNILTSQGLFFEGMSLIQAYPQFAGLADLINTFANTAFVFLPVLIGFSATKTFGGNPYLGGLIGALMIHPDLLNGYGYGAAVIEGTIPTWDLFGLEIAKVGYQGTVLPIIVSSFFLAKIEQKLHKVIPSILDNLLTPLLTVFITGILTFVMIGPAMRVVGDSLTFILMWLFTNLGPLGGAIFGLTYAPTVVTGMHHSFLAVETQLLADIAHTGGSFIFPVAAMSNVAQGAAALAVVLIMKNDTKMKSLASASGLSALLGITEPAIFGVNLKLRYPFYAAMIGTAIASAYVTMVKVLAVSPGPAGLPGIIAIRPESMMNYIIGMIIAVVSTMIITIIFAKFNAKKTK